MCDYPRQVSSARGRPVIHIAETEGKPIVAKVAFGSDAEAQGTRARSHNTLSGRRAFKGAHKPSCSAGSFVNALAQTERGSSCRCWKGILMSRLRLNWRVGTVRFFSLRLLREPFVAEPMAITAAVLDGDIGLLTLPSFSASPPGIEVR